MHSRAVHHPHSTTQAHSEVNCVATDGKNRTTTRLRCSQVCRVEKRGDFDGSDELRKSKGPYPHYPPITCEEKRPRCDDAQAERTLAHDLAGVARRVPALCSPWHLRWRVRCRLRCGGAQREEAAARKRDRVAPDTDVRYCDRCLLRNVVPSQNEDRTAPGEVPRVKQQHYVVQCR